MNYKGFAGSIEFSKEDGVFFGRVLNVDGLNSYEGTSPEKLEVEFQKSVDAFLNL